MTPPPHTLYNSESNKFLCLPPRSEDLGHSIKKNSIIPQLEFPSDRCYVRLAPICILLSATTNCNNVSRIVTGKTEIATEKSEITRVTTSIS